MIPGHFSLQSASTQPWKQLVTSPSHPLSYSYPTDKAGRLILKILIQELGRIIAQFLFRKIQGWLQNFWNKIIIIITTNTFIVLTMCQALIKHFHNIHLIFIKPCGRCYYLHFINGENMSWRSYVTCSGSQSWQNGRLGSWAYELWLQNLGS